MTVNSFIHYMTPFSHSNKNCECVLRGIFGRWDGEGYPSCNEIQSNVALSRMVVIKLSVFYISVRLLTSF
jgi:hypothetical protein